MEKEKKAIGGNPFIEKLKDFVGKKVEVVIFSNGQENAETGTLLVIDFIQKSVIIKNEKGTILIPRFIKLILSD